MTKFILILSMFSLMLVSCNKGEQAGSTGSGAGIQKEEYRMDDANITTPIDNRPDLEEEE
jgi:hypothetical protein